MELTLKQHIYRIYTKYFGRLFLFYTLMGLLYIFIIESGFAVRTFKDSINTTSVFIGEYVIDIFRDIDQIAFGIFILSFIYVLYLINRDLNKLASSELGVILTAISKQKFKNTCSISEFEIIRLNLEKTTKERNIEMAKNKEIDDTMKKQIAFINHDMKTPVSIIKSSASLIKKEINSEKNSIRLQRIIEQSDIASNYLDELQNLIECFKLAISNEKLYALCDITEKIKNIVMLYSDIFEVEIIIDIAPSINLLENSVTIDLVKLEKSIIHILNNAVSNCNKKPIEVKIYELDNFLNISIIDDGVGFKNNDFDSPKELFKTSNIARTSGKGYGIGLYYVESYLSAIGGRLILTNTGNSKGAKVTIQLEVVEWN